MALVNQAFRFGLKAGTVLPLMIAKAGGNALLNAITKGSADQAARGDYEFEIADQALVEIDVNEPRLVGTAVIGGAIYGMLVYRFYNKLKLAERLALASEFLVDIRASIDTVLTRMRVIGRIGDDIAAGMSVAEYELKLMALTTQNALIGTERRKLDSYVLMLEGLNDVSVEQVIRQNNLVGVQLKQLEAVEDIMKSSSIKGFSPDDLGALKQLLDPKDAMGIKTTLNTVATYLDTLDDAIRNSQAVGSSAKGLIGGGRIPSAATIKAMGMQITGVESFNVQKAAGALNEANLDKRLVSIGDASDDLNFKAGKQAGSLVGRVAGKLLLVDTIIWGTSLGLDLGLNLFLSEEEQANIPVIGFLFEGAGWSPIGAIIEGIIDFFVEPETQQSLFDVFIGVLIAASQEELLEDAVIAILNFYVNEISAELLVPLEFGREIDYGGIPLLRIQDPLRVLEVFTYAIVAKIVFNAWVRPAFGFFMKQTAVSA
jgi:hypothetical protein